MGVADIMQITAQDIFDRFGHPDVVWASPPCEAYSVAAIGKNWIQGTNLPKTEKAAQAIKLLEHTVKLIKDLNPKLFFIENPRGKVKSLYAVKACSTCALQFTDDCLLEECMDACSSFAEGDVPYK